MTGMDEVGSIGWYAVLGVMSTPSARSSRWVHGFRRASRGLGSSIRGESGRLSDHEQVAECAPSEAIAPAPHQLDETCRGRLGIGERVVRPAMDDAQLPAQPFQADGVTEIEELGGKTGGVQVVRVEA
jgi:hypothetical protein